MSYRITYGTRYIQSEWAWRFPFLLQIVPSPSSPFFLLTCTEHEQVSSSPLASSLSRSHRAGSPHVGARPSASPRSPNCVACRRRTCASSTSSSKFVLRPRSTARSLASATRRSCSSLAPAPRTKGGGWSSGARSHSGATYSSAGA